MDKSRTHDEYIVVVEYVSGGAINHEDFRVAGHFVEIFFYGLRVLVEEVVVQVLGVYLPFLITALSKVSAKKPTMPLVFKASWTC